MSIRISDNVVGDEEIPLSTSNIDTDGIFRYDESSEQYIYNLNTGSLSKGIWLLKAVMDDGKEYVVEIGIK